MSANTPKYSVMGPQNFTQKSQEALQRAAQISNENGQPHIEPPHLFLSLLSQDNGVVISVLKKLNIATAPLRTQVQQMISSLPKQFGQMGSLGK